MKKVAIYVRVSTQEQAEHGYSIEAQIDKLRKYCEAKDWIISEEYIDAGYSGAKLDRPAMQKLMRDAQSNKMDMVLVYKLDRLSRSQKDTLYLIEEIFNANEVDFTSMQENFDTSTPLGMAMVGILSVFAQLERSQIRERMTLGMEARVKQGKYRGGNNDPIGYKYNPETDILEPIDYEAMQVQEIYKHYLDGWTIHKIWGYMQEHYSQRYGKWTRDTTIRRILENPVYTGKVKYRGKYYDGLHEALIDEETFQRVQEKLAKDAKLLQKSGLSPFKRKYLLTGIMYCGKCGRRMCCAPHGSGKYKKHAYSCPNRRGGYRIPEDQRCDNKYWLTDKLEAKVWDRLEELTDLFPWDSDTLDQSLDTSGTEEQIATLKKEIESKDRQMEKLMELYSLGNMPADILSAQIQKVSDDRETISKEIARLESETPEPVDMDAVRDLFKDIHDIRENGTEEQQRTLITSILDRIVVYDEEIYLSLNSFVDPNGAISKGYVNPQTGKSINMETAKRLFDSGVYLLKTGLDSGIALDEMVLGRA